MTIDVCGDPDLLRIMLLVNNILTIVKISLPLIIIVLATIDIGKSSMRGDQGELKKTIIKSGRRLLSAIIVFFIPTIIAVVFDLAGRSTEFTDCFTNATEENVKAVNLRRAELALIEAESSLEENDYSTAYTYIYNLMECTEKENYIERLKAVRLTLNNKQQNTVYVQPKKKNPSSNNNHVTQSGKLAVVGSYVSSGTAKAKAGVKLKTEPDPSAAINYWSQYINPDNFIYPKDETTGLPLGAWPKNYESIPTQLSNFKTYQNGKIIFPVTPTNGQYHFVYQHVGIDIMAEIGTPIYSPVDGNLYYSEWGQTVNTGGDETAYTVSIKLDKPFSYNGVTVNTVFLTHMSGIRYRCPSGKCKRHVKQGELIGFVGTASGSAESIGYAPHLHMTYYQVTNYKGGLKTTATEALYGIPTKTGEYAIKAGE